MSQAPQPPSNCVRTRRLGGLRLKYRNSLCENAYSRSQDAASIYSAFWGQTMSKTSASLRTTVPRRPLRWAHSLSPWALPLPKRRPRSRPSTRFRVAIRPRRAFETAVRRQVGDRGHRDGFAHRARRTSASTAPIQVITLEASPFSKASSTPSRTDPGLLDRSRLARSSSTTSSAASSSKAASASTRSRSAASAPSARWSC